MSNKWMKYRRILKIKKLSIAKLLLSMNFVD